MTDTNAANASPRYHHGDLRGALLRAAEAELTEKGVEGFTLRGCAKRAGVSHAAPAHHFKDANALLTALAVEGFERFIAAMQARQAEAGDAPKARLVGAGLGYVDFARANTALFRLMFSSFRPDFEDARLHETARRAFDILVEGVGRVRGVDPYHDPRAMLDVAAAWSAAHGVADLALSGRIAFVSDEIDAELQFASIIARSVPDW